MRKKLYTKGPWTIEHSFNVKGHGRDGVFRIVAGCGGYSTNMSDPTPENIANANLVSAAPELLVLLDVAICPNCDGSGVTANHVIHTIQDYDDGMGWPVGVVEYEPEQCQWCHEKEQALKKVYGETI